MDSLDAKEQMSAAAEHASHSSGKRIALLIAVLAAMLAVSETGGKTAQTESLDRQIAASDLWSFFQAKTVRMTVLTAAADSAELSKNAALPPDRLAAIDAQVARWRADAARYDSDPATGEGRKELSARAKAEERARTHALASLHHFEYASGALQLAIVLASAAVITGTFSLCIGAMVLGAAASTVVALGWFAPTLLPF